MSIDILNIKKAYLIGIKGVGMTALAGILKELGIKVVGSDVEDKFFTDEVLKREKIKFYEGFSIKNIKKEMPFDVVISSIAYIIKPNDEVKLVQKLNLPFLTYPQALAQIFNNSFGIAVCGSHGKSSTTAVLGKILKDNNYEPTVLVGSEVIEWQSNSLISKNFRQKIEFLKNNENKLNDFKWFQKNIKKLPLFVIEADEYRDAFLNYFPRIIIVTNIDYDHPDYFKNAKNYFNSFLKFSQNLKLPRILISYENFPRLKNINYFKVNFDPKLNFPFPFAGIHFQKNLQLLFKLAEILKINKNKFIKSINNYKGLKRRFEVIGHKNDVYLIDDYAHHPNEILSFYNSLRMTFPDHKIFFIFQPHTFSRTHFLFKKFVKIFKEIKKDKKTEVIIFKTFPSARERDIVLKIKNLKRDIDLTQKLNFSFYSGFKNLAKFLNKNLNKNINQKIIIATVGAGDAYKILEMIKI